MSAPASPGESASLVRHIVGVLREPLNWLLVAIPVAAWLHHSGAGHLWVFLASALAIVPLAGLMGRATENLSETMGAGVGGLMNATFGNAAELIIAMAALRQGPEMYPLVHASLTGSIIGNILLVLGLSLLAGGFKYKSLSFNATAAGMGSTMLAISVIGMLVPTLFYYGVVIDRHVGKDDRATIMRQAGGEAPPVIVEAPGKGKDNGKEEGERVGLISKEISVVLFVTYILSLIFSLVTHQHIFAGPEEDLPTSGDHHAPEWNRTASGLVLLIATGFVAWMSEILVASVEPACDSLGMSRAFVGVIVVAIIGNAAEHSTAVLMAMKNKVDLSVNIAVGSSLQIALFVTPVLVFASMYINPQEPLDLHFRPMEIMALVLAIGVLALVCHDGESHWLEGVMLLAVYIILGVAFFHLPQEAQPEHAGPAAVVQPAEPQGAAVPAAK
jgi:Ca2+:H+ antiporter